LKQARIFDDRPDGVWRFVSQQVRSASPALCRSRRNQIKGHTERPAQFLKRLRGWIRLASLNPTDVSLSNSRRFRELLLGQPRRHSLLKQTRAEAKAHPRCFKLAHFLRIGLHFDLGYEILKVLVIHGLLPPIFHIWVIPHIGWK
jgi:hypothetical protein